MKPTCRWCGLPGYRGQHGCTGRPETREARMVMKRRDGFPESVIEASEPARVQGDEA